MKTQILFAGKKPVEKSPYQERINAMKGVWASNTVREGKRKIISHRKGWLAHSLLRGHYNYTPKRG